jgi:segregation and condensation protein B
MIEKSQLRKILEGAILSHGQPVSVDKLHSLFVTETKETEEGDELPVEAQVSKQDILESLNEIQQSCDDNGFELKEVASGWRFQVKEENAAWVNRLWDEKPQRYSRALMETIAIIAYRQPITRGDIEEIRGVAVSSHIIKTLTERDWIKVIGHRDVPGRPSLFATTKNFLDYFNLQSLEQLPSLQELTDIDLLNPELNLQDVPPTNDEEDVDGVVVAEGSDVAESPESKTENNTENNTESFKEEVQEDFSLVQQNTDEAEAEAEVNTETKSSNDEQAIH